LAQYVRVVVFSHQDVDEYAEHGLLNELERRAATRIIARAPTVKRIVADGEKVFGPLAHRFPNLEARDFGEQHHVAVAAASIVAKDRRDHLFAKIAKRYHEEFGPIRGGGYVNGATADFLRRYHERYRSLPEETRRSWGWKVLTELEPRSLPLFRKLEVRVELELDSE
jgi:ribonuclease HII